MTHGVLSLYLPGCDVRTVETDVEPDGVNLLDVAVGEDAVWNAVDGWMDGAEMSG